MTWQTYEAGRPAVKYGLQPVNYSQVQYGTFSTYSADDLCSQPASVWGYSSPGIINTAVLQNLQPGTTYYYIYGQEVSRKLLGREGPSHQGFKQWTPSAAGSSSRPQQLSRTKHSPATKLYSLVGDGCTKSNTSSHNTKQ